MLVIEKTIVRKKNYSPVVWLITIHFYLEYICNGHCFCCVMIPLATQKNIHILSFVPSRTLYKMSTVLFLKNYWMSVGGWNQLNAYVCDQKSYVKQRLRTNRNAHQYVIEEMWIVVLSSTRPLKWRGSRRWFSEGHHKCNIMALNNKQNSSSNSKKQVLSDDGWSKRPMYVFLLFY
jgi:hypothetical protein